MIDRILALAESFKKHDVKYLFIGKGAAILYGYPGTTQDIDIFPEKSEKNCLNLVRALKENGFHLDQILEDAILQGKDFIQIRGGPVPLDIIFAPDGINSFEEAEKNKTIINGRFSCASIDDIIRSKKAAKRERQTRDSQTGSLQG
jgi:hypothetical protein